jgi:hypothetical protein
MPSVATRRSDTKVLSSLKRNTPGRWPIERNHACPPQGVHSTLRSIFVSVSEETAHVSRPVLRRPHDHHRDLRARLRAETPAHTGSGGDQDRHLVMPSPPIDRRYDTRHSRWLAAGRAQARTRPLDSQPVAPPIVAHNVPSARLPRRAHPGFAVNRSQQPLPTHILLPDPATKSP